MAWGGGGRHTLHMTAKACSRAATSTLHAACPQCHPVQFAGQLLLAGRIWRALQRKSLSQHVQWCKSTAPCMLGTHRDRAAQAPPSGGGDADHVPLQPQHPLAHHVPRVLHAARDHHVACTAAARRGVSAKPAWAPTPAWDLQAGAGPPCACPASCPGRCAARLVSWDVPPATSGCEARPALPLASIGWDESNCRCKHTVVPPVQASIGRMHHGVTH